MATGVRPAAALCLALAGLVGCDGGKEMPAAKTVPVKAKLVLGGKPLSGGRVTLVTLETARYGPAETTADVKPDGTITPAAIGGQEGLMPGKWKVVVSPVGYKDGRPYRVKEAIPARYTKEDTTDLVLDVPDGGLDNATLTLRQ